MSQHAVFMQAGTDAIFALRSTRKHGNQKPTDTRKDFASAGDRPTSTPHLCNLTRYSQENILACMAETQTISSRKIITAQNLDEAKTAAYTNDPQTELVILGLSENAAVTTCGWVKHFFENRPTGF
jgi:hypothetical protein